MTNSEWLRSLDEETLEKILINKWCMYMPWCIVEDDPEDCNCLKNCIEWLRTSYGELMRLEEE